MPEDDRYEYVILEDEEPCSECGEPDDTGWKNAAGVFICETCGEDMIEEDGGLEE